MIDWCSASRVVAGRKIVGPTRLWLPWHIASVRALAIDSNRPLNDAGRGWSISEFVNADDGRFIQGSV
jgi:hypothetical protein